MKKIKSILLLLLCFALLTGFSPVQKVEDYGEGAEISVNENVPESVIINGEIRNIRFVTREEAKMDTSNDLLFVPIDAPYDENSTLISPNSLKDKIAVFIGDQIVGYVSGKVIEYVVGTPFGQAVIAKAVSIALAVWPYALAIGAGVVAYYLIMNYTKNLPEYRYVKNGLGCIWHGPRVGGSWICPFSI